MEERYLGRIVPDMDVCDVNGDRIGTVARVHRREPATIGGEGRPDQEDVIEVKTGFLGLGKHLYVPLSAIREVTQACVFLGASRDDVRRLNWDVRPAYLEEPR